VDDVTDNTAADWLASLPPGSPCRVVAARLADAVTAPLSASPHDAARNHNVGLVVPGEAGATP